MLTKLDIIIHYPETEKLKDECSRRYAKAQAQVLINSFPPEVIDKVIEKIEQEGLLDKLLDK